MQVRSSGWSSASGPEAGVPIQGTWDRGPAAQAGWWLRAGRGARRSYLGSRARPARGPRRAARPSAGRTPPHRLRVPAAGPARLRRPPWPLARPARCAPLAAAAAAAGPRNRGEITPPNDCPARGAAAAPAGDLARPRVTANGGVRRGQRQPISGRRAAANRGARGAGPQRAEEPGGGASRPHALLCASPSPCGSDRADGTGRAEFAPAGADGRDLRGRILGTRRLASVTGRGRAGRAPGRGGEAPFEGPWPGPVSGSPRTPSVPRTVGPPRAVPPGTSLTGGWGQCPPEGGDRKVVSLFQI